jgi:pyridoxine 5-phosphate synthase
MAVTPAMVGFAADAHPDDACFVPEKREELTTEGGLDIVSHKRKVTDAVQHLQGCGIKVSLFVDPVREQIEAAAETGAHAVEIHTGGYCDAAGAARDIQFAAIVEAATLADSLGLEVHAGHGLDYRNVVPIASIPEVVELNIGHSIIGRAVIVGIEQAVREMNELLTPVRGS